MNKKRRENRIKIYYCNVTGVKSKIPSTQEILDKIKATVGILCETFLEENETIHFTGYKSICRNRKERRGGLAILIREDWVKRVIKITEQEEKKEIEVLMVRIFKGRRPINIITTYGIQEESTEESQEEVKKQMEIWEEAVISITRRKEDLVWIGDLNVKRGNGSKGIQGNKEEITKGGKYLRKIIKRQSIELINAGRKCAGLWTRVNTQKKEDKSILDYVMVNKELETSVKKMIIDEKGLSVPTRYLSKKTVETDHRAIIVDIALDNRQEEVKEKQEKKWNFNKKGAWEEYTKRSEGRQIMIQIWTDEERSIQERYNMRSRELVEISNESFGQKIIQKKRKEEILTEQTRKKRSKCDKTKTKELIHRTRIR